MARGTQLQTLVDMLKHELGRSTRPGLGADGEEALKYALRREQERLYAKHDWDFLRMMPFKALAAGQRYYDPPTALDLDRGIESVAIWYNGEPHSIERGISFAEYASYSSDDDERSDPVLRWDVRWIESLSARQIEVWPIPITNDTRLQFRGFRELHPLVADTDTADLDDNLIVLFAAARLLRRQKSDDAKDALAEATDLFNSLRGNTRAGETPIVYGGGQVPRRPRGHVVVRVS